MARNPNAQKFSTEIEPNFEAGLIQNAFVKGTLFIFKTIEQRNNLGAGFRQLDTETTTLALVVGGISDVMYKLVTNPTTEVTTDVDWKEIPLGVEGGIDALGEWDAVTGFVVTRGTQLLDTEAAAENGNFYVVTNSPNGTTNTYTGLFRGIQVTTFDGDVILSVGAYWAIIRPSTTWATLDVPQVIRDYENGIVITHNQDIATINGLSAVLATKFDANDVASKTINFNDIPAEKLVDLAFTRLYYYRKFLVGVNKSDSTYNAAEIDALLSGVAADVFDWNRPIRKLPALAEVPGGTKTTDGLEEIYYGTIDTVSVLTAIDPVQIGETVNPRITGQVTANDGVIQLIQIIDGADAVVGLPAFTPGDAVVNVDITLSGTIVPVDGDTTNYRIRTQVLYPPSVSTVNEDSLATTIDAVYPYLFGMAATGLVAATIYAGLTKKTVIEQNLKEAFTGTDQRVYFAFPEDYVDLTEILDESMADTLLSYTKTIVAVESAGLTTDWIKNYDVYEINYSLTLLAHNIQFIGLPTDISTLDDINEGITNKHFTAGEQDKLAGIPAAGDIGDMLQSVYDPDDKGYTKFTQQIVVEGFNDTGATIGQFKLVNFVLWDDTNERAEFQLADKDTNLEANGITLFSIVDQAAALILRSGIIEGVDTSTAAIRDIVYLAANGNFTLTAPSSGLIQPIGQVAKVGVGDGAILIRTKLRSEIFSRLPDWVALTTYDQGATIFFEDATIKALFRALSSHTAGVNFITDLVGGKWEALTGDMTSLLYDPADKRVNVYDMDQMENGSSLVAMTVAERAKLGGLEEPAFKGVFPTPDTLRLAFPTSVNGDNAQVTFENDGMTPNGNLWIWDSLAPNNVSPPTTGGDWVDSGTAASGDMRSEIYDPNSVVGDAFGMENMIEEIGVAGPEAKVFIESERAKLAGIEALAEVNPLAPEVKTLYESNADTNAFTDAEQTKLAGIEALAAVNRLRVMGTLHFTSVGGVAVVAGELTNPVTLSIFNDNVSSPAGGRLAADIASNVTVTVSVTGEMAANSTSAEIQININGVPIPGAQAGFGRGTQVFRHNAATTFTIQMAATDYVSVFVTGAAFTLYDMQITLNGESQ